MFVFQTMQIDEDSEVIHVNDLPADGIPNMEGSQEMDCNLAME